VSKAISVTGMRSFVAVCEAGGVRAAADQVGRTPSAVSMTLKQLEDDIGAPLFEGERRGALSPVGRILLEEARAMIAHYDRVCPATRCAANRPSSPALFQSLPLADPRASRTVGRVAKAGRALQPAARQALECLRREKRDGAQEFGYAAL
jgi:DNA-binding transcriptional LysR family regulator